MPNFSESLVQTMKRSNKQESHTGTINCFPNDHVFILPHAEEYWVFFAISVDQVLTCLNAPETHEGWLDDRYTAEKNFRKRRYFSRRA